MAIDEYRVVDGSGYVDTGVGSSKAVALVSEGEFDAKPCLGSSSRRINRLHQL